MRKVISKASPEGPARLIRRVPVACQNRLKGPENYGFGRKTARGSDLAISRTETWESGERDSRGFTDLAPGLWRNKTNQSSLSAFAAIVDA